jgi:hypothetical protein
MSLCAVTTLFNLTPGRVSNYLKFYENMKKCGIKTCLIQEYSGFSISADFYIPVAPGAKLWQKERFVNQAVKLLPEDFDSVLIMDSDIIWPNHSREDMKSFRHQIDNQLETCPAVQCYRWLEYLDENGNPNLVRNSVVSALHANSYDAVRDSFYEKTGPALGGAWAYRTKWLRDNPLYECCIVGGGDSAYALALLNMTDVYHFMRPVIPAMTNHYMDWYYATISETLVPVGFVNTTLQHLYHGELDNRHWRERHKLLANFNPATDLDFSKPALNWTKSAEIKGLPQIVNDYFVSRKDS